MRHENIDPDYAHECAADSVITGGPDFHHPTLYQTHVVWRRTPEVCYDATVCQTHLAWSAMFMAGEEAPAYHTDVFTEFRIEPLDWIPFRPGS